MIAPTPTEQETREFFAGAQRRAAYIALVICLVGTTASFARWGSRVGVAFLIGSIVGGLNAYWLSKSTEAFTKKVVQYSDPDQAYLRPGGGAVLIKFVLRYLLVGVAAYVIFKSSVFSILGFFSGLFLPVAALMCEALYEAWSSYRRGL